MDRPAKRNFLPAGASGQIQSPDILNLNLIIISQTFKYNQLRYKQSSLTSGAGQNCVGIDGIAGTT
jgi:hypothetical protein